MIKKLIPILFLFGCTKDIDMPIPTKTYRLEINGVVNQNGIGSLPKDANGYYHLKLDKTKNQTVHRVNGRILVNGKEPYPSEKIEWESNLYWWLWKDDIVANITKTYINEFTGQLMYINLPPLTNWRDVLIPTCNPASYSGTNGEINTMIAPVNKMRGDTMVIKVSNYSSKLFILEKIVLE